MNGKPENRIDRIVSDLLRGRRLRLRGGDAEEKEAITMAARLAGARHGEQRMHPAFRRRLERDLAQAPRDGHMTRRMALVAGLGLAAGATTGGLLGRALEPRLATAPGATIDPVNGKWIDVAALDDLVDGHGKQVAAGSVGAFVFRRGNQVTAVSSVCSHLPCELWWDRGARHLACPCHPAAFDADGAPTTAYGLEPLNQVRVRVTAARRVEVLGTA